jgi:hypothetical protein
LKITMERDVVSSKKAKGKAKGKGKKGPSPRERAAARGVPLPPSEACKHAAAEPCVPGECQPPAPEGPLAPPPAENVSPEVTATTSAAASGKASPQRKLDGKPLSDAAGIGVDTRETVTHVLNADHYQLRLTQRGLEAARKKGPGKLHAALEKKVRPRPDADEIPKGAKAREAAALIARAMTL